MTHVLETGISQIYPDRILVRGHNVVDLAKDHSFGDMIYLLLRGELPPGQEGRLIEATDLELAPVEPEDGDLDLRAARTRAEFEVLQKAIARSRGRLAHAAKLLGISRPTLYTLLEAHGLSVESITNTLPDPDLPASGAGPGPSPGGPNTGSHGNTVPLHNTD